MERISAIVAARNSTVTRVPSTTESVSLLDITELLADISDRGDASLS
jgi:hypothetical protein